MGDGTGTVRREHAAKVAARARGLVAAELERRGAAVREVLAGRRRELRVRVGRGAEVEVRVVSRSYGEWQVTLRAGETDVRPGRFWVFVDLGNTVAFAVVPDVEVVTAVGIRHRLACAGRRVSPDADVQRSVSGWQVAPWAGRWDVLGLS